MGKRVEWVITVVDNRSSWRKASAVALIREAGLPLCVATAWAIARREMSPSGLKRKLREQRN